jgi:hypothetical protein
MNFEKSKFCEEDAKIDHRALFFMWQGAAGSMKIRARQALPAQKMSRAKTGR